MSNLNIYHMHLIEQLFSCMSIHEFSSFLDEFSCRLSENNPEGAQELIDRQLSYYGLTRGQQ